MSYLSRVKAALDEIAAQHRLRAIALREPSAAIDFSSNDYLALSTDSRVLGALRCADRAGSGGARLLGGRHREHWALEEELAAHLGRERTLLFSSGYLAALGAITALSNVVGAAYSDALNHACLIDGLRLTRLAREIYPHGKMPPRAQRISGSLIITESIFSMDGDSVDISAMLAELGGDDILLVDDAHALGAVGPNGIGLAAQIDDPRIVILGTLSKALGAQGGFVAGPAPVIELLLNSARTFIFDTALVPAVAAAARIALQIVREEEDRRERLHRSVRQLRSGLETLGFATFNNLTPIVPVVLGEERRALAIEKDLFDRGIYAPAVRPPTVPVGSSRLRVSLRADHTEPQIAALIEELQCTVIS